MFWKKKDFKFACKTKDFPLSPYRYLFDVRGKAKTKIQRKVNKRGVVGQVLCVCITRFDYDTFNVEVHHCGFTSLVNFEDKRLNRVLRKVASEYLESKEGRDKETVSRLISEINLKLGCGNFPFNVCGKINNKYIGEIETFLDSIECRGYSIGQSQDFFLNAFDNEEYTTLEITVK